MHDHMHGLVHAATAGSLICHGTAPAQQTDACRRSFPVDESYMQFEPYLVFQHQAAAPAGASALQYATAAQGVKVGAFTATGARCSSGTWRPRLAAAAWSSIRQWLGVWVAAPPAAQRQAHRCCCLRLHSVVRARQLIRSAAQGLALVDLLLMPPVHAQSCHMMHRLCSVACSVTKVVVGNARQQVRQLAAATPGHQSLSSLVVSRLAPRPAVDASCQLHNAYDWHTETLNTTLQSVPHPSGLQATASSAAA